MSPFVFASPAQKKYLKSLGAMGLNPQLGESEEET